VTSGLVAECLDAFSALASRNEVILMWVPWHCGIPGNEGADKLARQGEAVPLLGPEPALGILGPQQEMLLITGLSANIIPPAIIDQVTDKVNFLLVDNLRKELKAYLN
jgi:hypothetical protein